MMWRLAVCPGELPTSRFDSCQEGPGLRTAIFAWTAGATRDAHLTLVLMACQGFVAGRSGGRRAGEGGRPRRGAAVPVGAQWQCRHIGLPPHSECRSLASEFGVQAKDAPWAREIDATSPAKPSSPRRWLPGVENAAIARCGTKSVKAPWAADDLELLQRPTPSERRPGSAGRTAPRRGTRRSPSRPTVGSPCCSPPRAHPPRGRRPVRTHGYRNPSRGEYGFACALLPATTRVRVGGTAPRGLGLRSTAVLETLACAVERVVGQ